MNEFEVDILLGFPSEFEAILARNVSDAAALFPNSLRMLQGIAMAAQRQWMEYASGKALPDGRTIRRSSGSYAESIQIRTELSGGQVIRYVIYSDAPVAAMLEYGTPAFDMKRVLNTSDKVRISKGGKRYLIIPFRHGSSGALGVAGFAGVMPTPINSFMLTRAPSLISGSYKEVSVNNDKEVTRLRYQWGDRLTARDVEDLGLDAESKAGRNMVGMVKMRGREASDGSQNLTFRVISEGGKGWINPGFKAYGVAATVAQWIEAQYPAMMEAALQADVQRLKGTQ